MNDVENEGDAARQSFSNKAPMSSIFLESLIIIDDQWLQKKLKLTGALLDDLFLVESAYIENVTFSI